MIDTTDLPSYYPGYDEYIEPREENQGDEDFDIDAIIDERRLQEMEEAKKEVKLFTVVYQQEANGSKFDIITYHAPFLEQIYKQDKSTYLAIKNTVIKSFENIENKAKEVQNGSNQGK